MSNKPLELTQVKNKISQLKTNWQLLPNSIENIYSFKDFAEAMGFVNKIAELANRLNHHPEININYNKVKISLSTHSAFGLSEKDFKLAQEIEQILESIWLEAEH